MDLEKNTHISDINDEPTNTIGGNFTHNIIGNNFYNNNVKDGWIKITGYAINRSVIVEDKLIGTGYQWGYQSTKTSQLTRDILTMYTDKPITKRMVSDCEQGVFAQFPDGNFDLKIDIGTILSLVTGTYEGSKVHSHQLIKVNMEGNYYSKLLDFTNLPFSTCYYRVGTLEYDLLSYLTDDELDDIKKYTSKNSIRKALNKEEALVDVNTEFIGLINLKPNRPAYVVRGGMGTKDGFGVDNKGY